MRKATRAKLVLFYYECCLVPGVDSRLIRQWAEMITRLLGCKSGNTFRKLEAGDLQLPWQPLWRVLRKELWPKTALVDPTRNLVNILLYVAFHCKRYYPADAVPEMLETFLPLFTQTVRPFIYLMPANSTQPR